MALYEGVSTIVTHIKKMADGTHITQVIKNGVIVDEVPTHHSQIRPERQSMLYQPLMPEDDGGELLDLSIKRKTRKR